MLRCGRSRFRETHLLFIASLGAGLLLRVHGSPPNFGKRIDCGLLEHAALNEASGLAASRRNPGILWTHNDSDNQSLIFALDSEGNHVAAFALPGANCRDWEDIAVGPGPVPGEHYLFIGNIGDNLARYEHKYIYRVPEPSLSDSLVAPSSISAAETITFRFPDGRRDAEALMVDPLTRDVYIVSKRESRARVYRAPFPQSTSEVITVEYVGTLDMTNVVAGDISPSGLEVVLKTYDTIYYWRRRQEQTLAEILQTEPMVLPYVVEPQGEAVCWDADGLGYYTTSEELASMPAHLYYYPRRESTVEQE